jgi:predicted amino acid dehydrogenase
VYVSISVEISGLWSHRLLDPHQGSVSMVLRSDSKRLREELEAAEAEMQDAVVDKYESLVLERKKV